MTDEEAKYAFNANMMSGAMLSNGPSEFGKQHNRRWLVTAYEAVSFHHQRKVPGIENGLNNKIKHQNINPVLMDHYWDILT
jgi:hypothetical protein